MRDHLRAFAKLVIALDSLPGVTLANSSTALFENNLLQIANDVLLQSILNVHYLVCANHLHLAISNSEQPPP